MPRYIYCNNGVFFTLMKEIGESSLSVIFDGDFQGEQVAVKCVQLSKLRAMFENATLSQTFENLNKHASNEHVVKLFDVLDDQDFR